MKILFLIPSLERGGAEGQLALLANGLAARGHLVSVAVLSGGGALEGNLVGVRLIDLGKRSRAGLPRALARLVGLVRSERPDILHGYMPTANILSTLVSAFSPDMRLVFGLRVSDIALRDLGLAGRLAYGLEARLAPRADLVIANSQSGSRHARGLGFPADRLVVVPNAVDAEHCRFDAEAGQRLRAEWGVEPGQRLVGLPARMDPMKDQLGFVQAAAGLAARMPELRFVLVGGGLEGYATRVRALAAELGLGGRVLFAGQRADMPAVYSALDVLCLCSAYGEGFPNVVAEGLSCGTPCVVTAAGDAALLAAAAGDAGLAVSPGNPEVLADALAEMLGRVESRGLELRRLAVEAVREYSPQALAERTEAQFMRLCQWPRNRG